MNTTEQYKLLSDDALAKFKIFCAAGKLPSPKGAFDAALPTKGNTMPKYRYVPVAGTANALFTRERMAYDEVDNTTEFARHILDFVHDKISEQDYAQLKKMLQGDAAEEESDAPIKGVEARGAQDASFDSLYPSAKKIGRDPYPGGFR